MRKLVLFMHVSLDGFVAGPNGEMDWIKADKEIFDFASERTNEADTALYGRVTFEMMESYWPTAGDQPDASKHDLEHSKWYNKVSKVVLSRTLRDADFSNTRIVSTDIPAEIAALKATKGKDILMFGSPSAAHLLMQADLIDDFWLFINPKLLGKGIPLFSGIQDSRNLKLLKATPFHSGVVGLHYRKQEAKH